MKYPLLLAGLLMTSAPIAIGAYPERSIRFVVPFPAGGGVDIVTRILAREMTEQLGRQVIVDNRSGASGAIGSELVARATPDGYTLLMGNVATHAVNVSLAKKLAYDPIKDFAQISLVAQVPGVLLVHPSSSINSVKDLIAAAKAKPGQLVYGSAGNGTPTHLAAELLKSLAGIDLVHVPYKGTPPALSDLMGGQITMIFSNIVTGMPMARAGKVRALGVTSAKRSNIAPDIPTIAESGLTGFREESWYGVLAPAGTPKEIVNKLHATILRVLGSSDVRERLAQQGADVVTNSPQEFRQFIQSEIQRYAKIIKDSGLRAE